MIGLRYNTLIEPWRKLWELWILGEWMASQVVEATKPAKAHSKDVPANGHLAQKNGNSLIPPLESGDRLSRAEFERRYNAHPEIKKAELIEGVVYVASPVRVRKHGVPHSHINGWLATYVAATPGLQIADNSTFRLDIDNEPQPDVSVWIEKGPLARATVDEDDYLIGAPELLIEIAASSAGVDLTAKKNAYRRNGVQEYMVLQVYEQKTSWFEWHEGEYREIEPEADGTVRSRVFPGLWFDSAKFWAGDLSGLLAVVQQGIASAEHSNFAERLAQH